MAKPKSEYVEEKLEESKNIESLPARLQYYLYDNFGSRFAMDYVDWLDEAEGVLEFIKFATPKLKKAKKAKKTKKGKK